MSFVEGKIQPADEPSQSEISRLKATMQDGNGEVAAAAARLLLDIGVELSENEIESLRRPVADAHHLYQGRLLSHLQIPGIDHRPHLGPVPELFPLSQRMRTSRAVMLLEEDGSNQAIEFLRNLAGGDAKSPLTKQARKTISRLKIE